MQTKLPDKFEDGRILDGYYASKPGDLHGAFLVSGPRGEMLRIISSGSQEGWEHVSVSARRRVPNWYEMCWIKEAFWTDDECVMQLHPPKVDHVNMHPNVLHLWRPVIEQIPMPPKIFV